MLKKYRVSLDVARQLKEAGFPREGCDAYWYSLPSFKGHYVLGEPNGMYEMDYAAPCVGRLGHELPIDTYSQARGGEDYTCTCMDFNIHIDSLVSEADARALCWLELKKKGLL